MKKAICILLCLTVIICLAGCSNEVSAEKFYEFTQKHNAARFYAAVEEYAAAAAAVSYFCRTDREFIFTDYTMTEKCIYSDEVFDGIKEKIDSDSNFKKVFIDCSIENKKYDVYYDAENIGGESKKDFGFILLSKNEKEICFCRFCDIDYDPTLTEKNEFVDFFEEEFIK